MYALALSNPVVLALPFHGIAIWVIIGIAVPIAILMAIFYFVTRT